MRPAVRGEDAPDVRLLISADDTSRAALRAVADEIDRVELVHAKTSLDALELIVGGVVDLCVADADDQLLGGLDLLQLALSAPGGADLPILILGSPDSPPGRSEALAAGAWDWLPKPVEPEATRPRLELAVRQLSERQARQRERAATLPRVVIGDPDKDYLSFARRALAGICRVDSASTALAATVAVLRDKPALALLDRGFHAVLSRTLEARPAHFGEVSRLVILDASPKDPGEVRRSLKAHELEGQVGSLLDSIEGDGPSRDGDLGAAPEVLNAALERFFSVMAGAPPEPGEGEPTPETGASIDLEVSRASGPLRLTVEFGCPIELRTRLAGAVYGLGGPSNDEDAASLLCELVNVAAGRLKAFCWEQRLDVKIGLPRPGLETSTQPDDRELYWRGLYRWKGLPCALTCYTA